MNRKVKIAQYGCGNPVGGAAVLPASGGLHRAGTGPGSGGIYPGLRRLLPDHRGDHGGISCHDGLSGMYRINRQHLQMRV